MEMVFRHSIYVDHHVAFDNEERIFYYSNLREDWHHSFLKYNF